MFKVYAEARRGTAGQGTGYATSPTGGRGGRRPLTIRGPRPAIAGGRGGTRGA